jgi:cyanophycinase
LLNELINEKKITIGGTSAGMAVLGEVVFTAENNTIWSSEALEDPFHWRMKLERDFLRIPHME